MWSSSPPEGVLAFESGMMESAGAAHGDQGGTPGSGTLLMRSLRLRCPQCGEGRVLVSWFRMRSVCPACGLKLQRNEEADYWTGGYLLNFILAELIVVLVMTAVVWATWPDVPWTAVLYVTGGAAVVGPLVTWPFSRNLWLGIDLMFRPAESADFDCRREPA